MEILNYSKVSYNQTSYFVTAQNTILSIVALQVAHGGFIIL